MDPRDGAAVSQPTTAYLSYDDLNLYVAFIAKDDPSLIRARVAKRKQILTDDRVTINIDTFHDHRHAYWFDVNPYAIQLDGITTDGYGDDFSWEGLWYTESKITEDGYVVLITVPFKTLRFPDTATTGVGRHARPLHPAQQRIRDVAVHHAPEAAAVCRAIRAHGRAREYFAGQEHAVHSLRTVIGSRYLDNPAGGVPQMVTEPGLRGGLDAKVVIKDALTLDLTLNPDFSQVESDEPQVTVNQRYEVFFPERRPFFMENASYFTTPQNLFFSRRIVDPEYRRAPHGQGGALGHRRSGG